ncbi:membrane protein [Acetobacter indonesiensis]|nr:membrane protein [Acetobacter indonesiensis]
MKYSDTRPVRKGHLTRRTLVALAPLALAACATGQTGVGGVGQTDTARVEAYLRTVSLNNVPFTQTWPNGTVGGGLLTYHAGYLHLVYTAPHAMDLEASGSHAVFKDSQAGSETRMGLAHNPLGLLMGNPIQLSGPVSVTDIQKPPGIMQVSLTRTENPSQGLVTLIFKDNGRTLSLFEIRIVDERRHTLFIRLQ